jgi:hypothetical protein
VIEIGGIFTNMVFYSGTDAHFNSALSVSVFLSVIVSTILWILFSAVASVVHDARTQEIRRFLALGLLITGPAGALAARQGREFGFGLLATRTVGRPPRRRRPRSFECVAWNRLVARSTASRHHDGGSSHSGVLWRFTCALRH